MADRYEMRIVVDQGSNDQSDKILQTIVSEKPFLSIHRGDKIWPKGLISPDAQEVAPFMYDAELVVQDVRHEIWNFSELGESKVHHGIEVRIANPYGSEV